MSAPLRRLLPRDDYSDGLDSDDEEEERRLSALHGEASDGRRKRPPATKAKGPALTEEDAAAAKEFEERVLKKSKRARPTLTAAELKGPSGLIRVRRSFPATVRKHREAPSRSKGARAAGSLARKRNDAAEIDAAASYSRSLMRAYRSFASELFPVLAAEDVFLKIEELGSKKEVREYLQLMRDEAREEHLKGIYGEERTKRVLHELEYGLARRGCDEVDYLDGRKTFGGDGGADANAHVTPRIGKAVFEDEEDGEGGGVSGVGAPPASQPPARAKAAAAAVNPYARKSEEKGASEGQEDAGEDADKAMGNDIVMEDTTVAEETGEEAGEKAQPGTGGEAGGDEKADEGEEEELIFSDAEDKVASKIQEDVEGGADEGIANDPAIVDPTHGEGAKEEEEQAEKAEEAPEKEAREEEEEATFSDAGDKDEDPGISGDPTVVEGAEEEEDVKAGDETKEKEEEELEATFSDADGKDNDAVAAEESPDADAVGKVAVEPEIESAIDVIAEEVHGTTVSEAIAESGRGTQETLTLLESQMEVDAEWGTTQTQPTQQPAHPFPVKEVGQDPGSLPTQDDRFSQTQDGRFSQTQDDRFSQTQDDRFSQTQDDRFSQTDRRGPMFEEDEEGGGIESGEHSAEQGVAGGGEPLGQTMATQLSLEY
ncbi:hypothetical protein ACHAWF_002248 [Thalassiosira exigua]